MRRARGLGRLSPTVRLIVFVVLSILSTLSSSWTAVLISLVVGSVLLVWGGVYPRAPLVGAWSAFLLTFFGHALFAGPEDVLFSWWVFRISEASLLTGLRLGLRIAAMILPAVAFVAVTPRYEYLEAFRGLKIPPAAEMYLTIVLRYVDILWYEIGISMKAMAMRGVHWQGGIRQRVSAFRRLMLPLVFRISEHVEGQALAIDNRGGVTARGHAPEVVPDAPAVAMRGVYVRYTEDTHALRGVELEVPRGGTTVLSGRNGSGKTTLLLLCTGLIPHSVGQMRGDVAIFGWNSKEVSLSQLGRLSRIVFPSAVQGLVGLTVEEELRISLRVSTLEEEAYRKAMVEALEAVGLDAGFLPRLTLGLSGGEMQRVALASAIVAQPLLLALDDVTVQLDPRGKQEVVAALHALLEEQITAVMTDPYVPLLQDVGDRYVLLEDGQVREERDSLDGEAIERAGLRMPQLLRLGQAVGIDLPRGIEAAIAVLQAWAGEALPPIPAPRTGPREGEAPYVVARDLTYAYPDGPRAVDGLSISLCRGEFVAVLGANGSGKTTLALLLAQAIEPAAGTIEIGGEPAAACHLGCVAYVFQEPVNQMVTMKVADELAFGPRQLGWEEAAVAQAVAREAERFELPLEEVPLHLPPAGARKLAVAANLTMNPQVIILDEPTNNLDEQDTTQLIGCLQELQGAGRTVVVITHDVEVACAYADRAIVMHAGRILAEGPTREVMGQPELLLESDVVAPPVVQLSLALWPDRLPALTVEELAGWLRATREIDGTSEGGGGERAHVLEGGGG